MAVDQELSALANVASLLSTDIIYLVRDPGGVAEADHKAAISVLDARYPGAVISVFGRTGAVVATSGDYSAAQITGLGTLAVLNSPLPIVNGGSGQITQQAAIDALSNVVAATNEHVLTKDTATGNAIFKASAGGGGSSLPVADTQTIVMGSADNTKLLRFEIDGFSAGATRVLTPPNQDTLLAGQNFANVFTAIQKINVNSTAALLVEQDGVIDNTLVVDTTNGRIGSGIASPKTAFELSRATAGTVAMRLSGASGTTPRIELTEHLTNPFERGGYIAYGNNINPNIQTRILELGSRFDSTTDNPAITIGTSTSCIFIGIMEGLPTSFVRSIGIGRHSAPAHADSIVIGVGANNDLTSPAANTITLGLEAVRLLVLTATGAGFGVDAPAAKADVRQTSTTAAIPSLRLQQADLSEEFIRFQATVGAGNPIDTAALGAYYGKVRVHVEGVGAKFMALYDS